MYRYTPNLKHAVIVGLLFGLSAFQIQFLALSGLFIMLYFLVYYKSLRIIHFFVIFLLPVLINLVWLSNFIFGGADINLVSINATKGSFQGTSYTDFINIFNFSFSKATLLSRFHEPFVLALFAVILFAPLLFLIVPHKKIVRRETALLMLLFVLMIFLATGLFQKLQLGPLVTLYPMFREVGHFAPIIWVTSLFLSIVVLPVGTRLGRVFVVMLALGVFLSSITYQVDSQKISYVAVRKQFRPFHDFEKKHRNSNYRALSYPFFDQYSYKKFPQKIDEYLPVSNTGHDSFTVYSSTKFIKTNVKPQDFKNSLQYKLLTTKNIDVLRPYSIRYLYDFSEIYESYYERYVSNVTYDNDLGLIKANSHFFDELLAANPGKLKRVAPHVLEVSGALPTIRVNTLTYSTDNTQSGTADMSFAQSLNANKEYSYISPGDGNPPGAFYQYSVFGSKENTETSTILSGVQSQIVNPPYKENTIFTSLSPTDIAYTVKDGAIYIHGVSDNKISVNNILQKDRISHNSLIDMKVESGATFYILYNNNLIPVDKEFGRIGEYMNGATLTVYKTNGDNLIANPSFETNLWQPKVSDCNNYDTKPIINMSRDSSTASNGKFSLKLAASNHTSCTSTQVSFKAKQTYIFTYDVQSTNAQRSSYYINLNNDDKLHFKDTPVIAGHGWETYATLLNTPEEVKFGKIFLHANPAYADAGESVMRYDNIHVLEASPIKTVTVPSLQRLYTSSKLIGSGPFNIEMKPAYYDLKNLLKNGSFEEGPWQEHVSDCTAFDKLADINMRVSTDTVTQGKKSLVLSSKHHAACTYSAVNIRPGMMYQLSFDYKNNKQTAAKYMVKFDDPKKTIKSFDLLAKDKKWNKFTGNFITPQGAKTAKIFLISPVINNESNTVYYDNVSLINVPNTSGMFYVVSDPMLMMTPPRLKNIVKVSHSQFNLNVENARTSFYLELSESYNPAWSLSVNGRTLNTHSSHYKYNDYGNGWYINTNEICQKHHICSQSPDGSYGFQIIATFKPQKWFQKCITISVFTLLAITSFLLNGVINARKVFRQ